MSELKDAGIAIIDKEAVDKLLSAKPEGTEVKLEDPRAQAGVLGGVTSFKVGAFPIGKVGAGLVIAGANDVLAGWLSGMLGTIAGKWAGLAAGIGGLWLLNTDTSKRWLGSEAVEAGTIVVLADLVTENIFDIRSRMKGLVSGLKLKQTMRGTVATGGNGSKEITSIEEYNRVHGLA
jgi:hypothetical protein